MSKNQQPSKPTDQPICVHLLDAVAHGGNHASSFNGGNLRNGLAPQDRAASLRSSVDTIIPKRSL